MKSTKVKVVRKDTPQLLALIHSLCPIAANLERNMLIMGGILAIDRDEKVLVDGPAERKLWYKKEFSVSLNEFEEMCDFLYKNFTLPNAGRRFATSFFGKREKLDKTNDDADGENDSPEVILPKKPQGRPPKKEKSQEDKDKDAKINGTLQKFMEWKILPFPQPPSDVPLHTNGYKYALVSFVHAKLTSYAAQIVSTQADYDALLSNISKKDLDLRETYSEATIERLKEFITKSEPIHLRFGYKFLQYITKAPRPLPVSFRWEENGKSGKFVCYPEVLNLLNEYSDLHTEENSILRADNLKEYAELIIRFKHKRQRPSYTPVRLDTFSLPLGNNAVKFELKLVEDRMLWSIGVKDNKIPFSTAFKRVGRGTTHYLQDLTIAINENDFHNLVFSINGRQPMNTVLKGPNIIYRNKNIYVQLPLNIQRDESDDKRLRKIRGYFNTAYPARVASVNQELLPQTKDTTLQSLITIDNPIIAIGVDLGLRGVATISSKHDGSYLSIANDGFFLEYDSVEVRKYTSLAVEIRKLSNIIASVRDFYILGEESDLSPAHLEYLKNKKASGIELNDLKRQRDWEVSIEFSNIRNKFISFIADRNKTYSWVSVPFWASLIKKFISLHKSYMHIGVNTTEKMANTSGICKKYQRMYTNAKEDYAKKMANYIVKMAVAKKAQFIIAEKLDSNLGDRDKKTKRDNEMHLAWNCGRIKRYIEAMAADYGILLIEVNEYETSQVHYESGNYGWRDEKNAAMLWYLPSDGSPPRYVHADINAAKNIILRFFSRHTNINSISIKRVNGDTFEPSYPNEDSKRNRGAVTFNFGCSNPKLNITGVSGKKPRAFRLITNAGTKWVSWEDKDAYVNSIRNMAYPVDHS